jgi:hypothetical protein
MESSSVTQLRAAFRSTEAAYLPLAVRTAICGRAGRLEGLAGGVRIPEWR